MKKSLLIIVLCLLITACSANNENVPVESEQSSNNSQAENMPTCDSSVAETTTALEPYQIYYDFFSNNFKIIEYKGTHEPWQLWGHSIQGEVRLSKQVYINQIEGFDYPVLILAEYTLGEDGVTLDGSGGFLNAYLIKNGELTSDLDRAEFDAIFKTASESEGGGWSTRYENETLPSVIANGARLFFLDFSGDVRADGSMDTVLDWLKESAPPTNAFTIDPAASSDPRQDTITISQVFERDGFSLDRIANIQLSINPVGDSVTVTTPEDIQAVWDTLSKLRISPEGDDQARINAEKAIVVDIQFANPNHATHVAWYGPIVIHGSEYYTFAEGFSEQALYDLIYEFIEPKPLPPVEAIHSASFADDGCLLFDNEHYELKQITQELTQDSVVVSFITTQTAIEGIGWDVFTIKEYPNREYLLLISGTNITWLCRLGCPNPYYQGFTQEQWNKLQGQKEKYRGLSEKERGGAAFNGEIDCPEFAHLWWEHSIDSNLIHYVGANEFESWLKEIDSVHNSDQCTIYSFSKYFSITLDELVLLIEPSGLTGVYDIETVKRRYEYFNGSGQV